MCAVCAATDALLAIVLEPKSRLRLRLLPFGFLGRAR
jgi:hypothetical protein